MKNALRILALAGSVALAGIGIAESVRLYRARLAYQIARKEYEDSGRSPGSRALECLNRSVRLAPGDPAPHYLLGRIAALQNRHEDALKHLLDAAVANPFDGRTHYYLGRANFNLGRTDDAVASMETAAVLSRNNPDHQYEIGYFFWFLWERESRSKVSDFRKAFSILRKAFRYFRAASEGDLKYLTLTLGLTQKYAIQYANMVEVIPDTPEAHFRAGHYFGHRRGLWTPALEEFKKTGHLFEDRWDFLFDRGLALLFRKSEPRPDPLPDLRRAIELSPRRDRTIRDLARYYILARPLGEGLRFWRELERKYPDLPGPGINRAETELERVRVSMKESIRKIGEEERRALARASSRGDREGITKHFEKKAEAAWREALLGLETHLQERLTVFPRSGEYYRLLGQVLVQAHRFQEAEVAFKHAAEFGEGPNLWKGYVRFLIRMNKYEEAWKTAIRAKTMFPNDKNLPNLIDRARDLMLSKKGN